MFFINKRIYKTQFWKCAQLHAHYMTSVDIFTSTEINRIKFPSDKTRPNSFFTKKQFGVIITVSQATTYQSRIQFFPPHIFRRVPVQKLLDSFESMELQMEFCWIKHLSYKLQISPYIPRHDRLSILQIEVQSFGCRKFLNPFIVISVPSRNFNVLLLGYRSWLKQVPNRLCSSKSVVQNLPQLYVIKS